MVPKSGVGTTTSCYSEKDDLTSKDGFPYRRTLPRAEDSDDKNYSIHHRRTIQNEGFGYVDPLKEHGYRTVPVREEEKDGLYRAVDMYFTSHGATLRTGPGLTKTTGGPSSVPESYGDDEGWEPIRTNRDPNDNSGYNDEFYRDFVSPAYPSGRDGRDVKPTGKDSKEEKDPREALPRQLWEDPFHYIGRTQMFWKICNHPYLKELNIGLVPLTVKSRTGLDSKDPFRTKRYYVKLCDGLGIRLLEESDGKTFLLLTFVFYDVSDKDLVANNNNIAGLDPTYDVDRDVASLEKEEDVGAFAEEKIKVRVLLRKKQEEKTTQDLDLPEVTKGEGEDLFKFDCFYLTCN